MDFDKQGRQAGYIELHNSTNESAWQLLRLPVFCFNGTPGPTTLVLGGMHGDEYEGPAAIHTLAHEIDIADVTGRLILIPALNLPAVMAGRRLTPDDGLNLNRVFPGDPHGSLTQRIAHMVTQDLIPLADNVIDLHSGGRSLNFAPSVLLHEVSGPPMDRGMKAARAFGAPFTVLLCEDHSDVMIDAVVEAQGKVMIASELGGSGVLTHETAALATNGLRRCLAALDHFNHDGPTPSTNVNRLPQSAEHIMCDDTMIFAPALGLGDPVQQGQVIGHQHRVDRSDIAPVAVAANSDGWLICVAGQGLVHRGDVAAIIGTDAGA